MARRYRGLMILGVAILCGYQTLGVRTQTISPPLLLITNSAAPNPFGAYLGEILRAEGLNEFSVQDLSNVAPSDLASASVVLLAETPLTASEANMFGNYVAGGGRLVAMRPDSQLSSILGTTPSGSVTTEGYVGIDTAMSSGTGFTATTLPFHGTADNYTLDAGATPLASLYADSTTPTAFAAVVRFGKTATWAFDLARSVAYTRQGNPANAGIERDGLPTIRTTEVFYQAIDLDRMALPHADIHMRLLSRVIQDLLSDAMPLPSLWYFPGAAKTLMVLAGDSHVSDESAYQGLLSAVESRAARISLYLSRYVTLASTDIPAWRANGHEIGMHPFGYPDNQTLATGYQLAENWFSSQGWGSPSHTVRNHYVEWQGWVDAAKLAANYGMQLDLTFYAWGPTVIYPDGITQAHGYLTGSGLPMRFVDETGALVPVYQQVTSLIDEQLITGSYSEGLSASAALAVSKQLIDDSQAAGYSAIATQWHVDFYRDYTSAWIAGTLDYANSLGLPMWTAERWLSYTTARAATTLDNVSWSSSSNQLAFTVTVPAGSEPQSVMLASTFGTMGLSSITLDGSASTATQQVITGREMSFLNVGPGSHSVVASYGPTIPPSWSLSIDDVSIVEGNSGTTNATFTVTLSAASAQTVTVGYSTTDGTAVAGLDYLAASGTLTFPPDTTTQTISVPVLGDTLFETDETFFVTLSGATNATIARAQSVGTIVNDDPMPSLSINNVTVTEPTSGSVNATFTVTLSAASGATTTVAYATEDGTATAGNDYTATSGTLTLPAGATTQTVSVPVLADTVFEVNETFRVNLSGATNATIAQAQGTGTIVNRNPMPSLSINNVTVAEPTSGSVPATFTVTLSAASGATTTVAYATANGTATAGGDYTATSGTATFPAGVTTQTVSVLVRADTAYEVNETFRVNLSGATNATIAQAQGTGTIVNSTPMPSLSINNITVTEGASGITHATLTVTLSAASGVTTTVGYATADGTATAGNDYITTSGTLTLTPGQASKTLSVSVVGDTVPEADKRFTVNLSGATNATIAQPTGTATILDTDGTMTVTSPATGANWGVGSIHRITWTNNLGSSAAVNLEISRDGGTTWSLIAASVQNSSSTGGSYDWTVTGPTTTSARIRAIWTVNTRLAPRSGGFTIANPTMTVTNPNSSSTIWSVDTTATITWTNNLGSLENVNIELSLDGGVTYPITLVAPTPSDGSEPVTVQSTWATTRGRVRITWLGNGAVFDISNQNFTIR